MKRTLAILAATAAASFAGDGEESKPECGPKVGDAAPAFRLTVLPEPADLDGRAAHGDRCVGDLGLTIPMVLDGMDNQVGEAYDAWPDRIYVLDKDGKVAWKAGPGPFRFDPFRARTAFLKLLGKWPKMC